MLPRKKVPFLIDGSRIRPIILSGVEGSHVLKMSGGKLDRYSCIVAREGWFIVFVFGLVALTFLTLGVEIVGLGLVILALFSLYFFRNPDRIAPEGGGIIVAPADGRVVEVSELTGNEYTGAPAKKVGIFMSVFDVHVNRVPIAGSVVDIKYRPGRFFVAAKNRASVANEQNAVLLDVGRRGTMAVVQIAGFVARRIVCYLSSGDRVEAGQRLGLIKFGSRVDLYMPIDCVLDVGMGSRVKAGSTIIGRFDEGNRQ